MNTQTTYTDTSQKQSLSISGELLAWESVHTGGGTMVDGIAVGNILISIDETSINFHLNSSTANNETIGELVLDALFLDNGSGVVYFEDAEAEKNVCELSCKSLQDLAFVHGYSRVDDSHVIIIHKDYQLHICCEDKLFFKVSERL